MAKKSWMSRGSETPSAGVPPAEANEPASAPSAGVPPAEANEPASAPSAGVPPVVRMRHLNPIVRGVALVRNLKCGKDGIFHVPAENVAQALSSGLVSID